VIQVQSFLNLKGLGNLAFARFRKLGSADTHSGLPILRGLAILNFHSDFITIQKSNYSFH